MIKVSEVTKIFTTNKSSLIALDKISFEARSGEVIGFLGPNGAGKTTTMRLLVGIFRPTRGEVFIDDLIPGIDKIDISKKIGYLPENNPLYGEMKVSEYLDFIAGIKGEKNKEAIVSALSINEVISKKIEELSRGYKQRVGLAASLFGNPTILILDEPTSGLDPIEQDKIKTLIKKIAKNKTIIFSTHILSEIEDVASRVVIINKGKIVYDGKKPKGKGTVEKLFKKLVK